jgi:hypothetical protein
MVASTSILDFTLPNATTWFYFSLLLAVALFFKFSRVLSVRNWDVLTLFLLVPGLLLLQDGLAQKADEIRRNVPAADQTWPLLVWFAYLWLLSGSAYFFIRCLIDLTLVRRPALSPNLTFGGLAWLALTLFVCLVSVALRPQPGSLETLGKVSSAVQMATKPAGQALAPHLAGFDADFWAWRILALGCHLLVVSGLIVVGWRHFQDLHGGMAAATFYLLLPYTAMQVGQLHHVWPAALVIWAVAAYRRPTLAGFLLGLGAGIGVFPILLLPVWFSFYWRRGAGRFLGAFVLVGCVTVAGSTLWLRQNLITDIHAVLRQSDWQPWLIPATTESFWQGIHGTGVHWAYRIPIFIAYLAFVLTTILWPAPKNLGHVLALSAAVLIGLQFWYADHGGVYVLWYLPLLLLLAFRPNLSDRLPAPIPPDADWLHRWSRRLKPLGGLLLRLPESPVRAR